MDYVGRNRQRKVVGICRVSNPLRLRTLRSHEVASPQVTVNDSLKVPGGRHDQIPSTIIPRTSLHCWHFRKFVFAWLGGIAVIVAFGMILFYFIPFLYFRH